MNGTRRNVRLSTARRWALSLAVLIPCASPAAEYTLEPTVDLQETYNDNIYMTSAAHDSVTGTILSPRLDFAARMETWQLGVEARLRDSRYHGVEGLDTTGRTINLYSQYRAERNALQLGGGRAKESTLTSALIDADTGLVKTQVIRTNDNASASWTWSVTEKDQMKLDYQYADVVYDNVSVANLYDYSQRGPSITLSHSLSQKTQFFLQAGNSKFSVPQLGTTHLGQSALVLDGGLELSIVPDPRDVSMESSTNNVQAGINYAISETVTGNLSAGARKTSSDTLNEACTGTRPPYVLEFDLGSVQLKRGTCDAVATSTTTATTRGSVYNASLTKKTETLQLTAGAARSINPSGAGTQVQNDTLNLSARWYKTERLAFTLSGVNSKVRALESTPAVVDRHLYNIAPGVEWRIGRASTVKLSYGYTQLSYVGVADSISSQQVSLAYSYAWDKISISR